MSVWNIVRTLGANLMARGTGATVAQVGFPGAVKAGIGNQILYKGGQFIYRHPALSTFVAGGAAYQLLKPGSTGANNATAQQLAQMLDQAKAQGLLSPEHAQMLYKAVAQGLMSEPEAQQVFAGIAAGQIDPTMVIQQLQMRDQQLRQQAAGQPGAAQGQPGNDVAADIAQYKASFQTTPEQIADVRKQLYGPAEAVVDQVNRPSWQRG